MVAKPVQIGARPFATKDKAKAAVREVLNRYNDGETLNIEDFGFIFDLLKLHSEAESKIGSGVVSIRVERSEQGTKCFWLTRADGSSTDFSYISCLTPNTKTKDATAAFRTAIQLQVIEFRDSVFSKKTSFPCPVTNVVLTTLNSHIDHHPKPFTEILQNFISEKGLSLDEVLVVPTKDADTTTKLADSQLETEWYEYHRKHAQLRVVSVRANLSKT